MVGKKYKRVKIRKNHLWVTILLFLIMSVMLVGIFSVSGSLFVNIVITSKISGEITSVSEMAHLYESAPDQQTKEHVLNESDMYYFFTDQSGNKKRSKGIDTCNRHGGFEYVVSGKNPVTCMLYPDRQTAALIPDEENMIIPDYFEFYKAVRKSLDEDNFDRMLEGDRKDTYVELPIWISVDINGGSEKLFVKRYVTADANSLLSLFAMLIVAGVIYVVVFTILLINMIRNILSQRRLTKALFTDAVTGDRNKTWFLMRGKKILRKHSSARKKYVVVSILFVKYLNFCISHSISEGEDLIRRICNDLKTVIGKKDICVHYDSSDFAVIVEIPPTASDTEAAAVSDEESIRRIAESLLNAAKNATDKYETAFQVGAFLIDVNTDENGKFVKRKDIDLEECFNNACTARYSLEKDDDTGIAYFDQVMIEEQKWINTVHEKQQEALRNEEFIVYYQPKYDPSTDKLRGAEALIRWQSPEFGFVTPNRFIPIFEKNGFITQIDHYMLHHVAMDQKKWLDQGMSCVPVSVNISRIHFSEPDLAEQIRDTVDMAGTPHALIEIELTESAFFDDKKAMLNTIKRLKEYGFSVSMDDFGAGYSSLNSLKDMPLDVLKLDAEFFRGDHADDRGRIVVAEAIRLANNLNMRTVAEGVEVKEQVDFLAELGCDMIQGYYYAKPMPAEDYEKSMD